MEVHLVDVGMFSTGIEVGNSIKQTLYTDTNNGEGQY